MNITMSAGVLHATSIVPTAAAPTAPPATGLLWSSLPRVAQLYVALVIVAGSTVLPRTFPRPVLFALMLMVACLTAAWKVYLPMPLTSGSTLSVSYGAKMMTLLLLGPRHAMLIAVAAAFTQCTYKAKRSYPLYR